MAVKTRFALILCLIVASSGIRLSGLERKFYWIDEVSSSFVITGNWPDQIEQTLSPQYGSIGSVGDVLDALEAHNHQSSADLLRSLSNDDPHHCPLYFLIAKQWASIFGPKPQSLRLLAAIIGSMSVPVFGWLCFEMFSTWGVALVGMTLLTVAPFHILYSQQNREYGLWFLMTALSTA